MLKPAKKKSVSKVSKKKGRPTAYNAQVATVICIRIAEGESLRNILKTEGMPAQSSVYEWLLRYPIFTEQYTRARDEQAETLADEITAISDELPSQIVDEKGKVRYDSAYVQWQRNRIDARKWVAMKLKPKKYGDKQIHSGDAENPLSIKVETGVFDSMLENLQSKRQLKE
jgi:hypothetical protein